MRHDPASGAIVIMLRSLKMHGMAQAVAELTEQAAPAFEAAIPILSQLLKAETAEREVRSTAYQLKTARLTGAPSFAICRACVAPRTWTRARERRSPRQCREASSYPFQPSRGHSATEARAE